MRLSALLALGLLVSSPAMAFDCAGLSGGKIEAGAIGLPSTGAVVTSAAAVNDPVNGSFCKLLGAIHPVDASAPDIVFQLNLPDNWNGKALQVGGGGYDGSLVTAEQTRFPDPAKPSALRQGYATFGSDGGHTAKPGQEMGTFALNKEALANYAGDQLKKTHDAAVVLLTRAYGKPPRRMYFQGNSQGGHEAFIVVQRWPQDYDGAIAIHPVYDIVALQTDGVLLGQAIYNRPGAWVPPAKVALVSNAVLDKCDGLDGLKDGVIGNIKACDAAFDIGALRCPQGKDDATCLTDPQLATFRTFASPMKLGVTLANGVDTFPKWPVLEGGSMAARFNPFGADAPQPPKAGGSFLYMMGDQLIRFMLMGDPQFDSLHFDPAAHADAMLALSRQVDANDPDISAFQKRGGKLLLMHGTVDMAVSPHNSIAYYEKLKSRFGKSLSDFARFYVAPGFGHGDGAFVVGWDSLGTLDAWVDKGVAPGPQIATDAAKETAGRTRPLCEYPAYPRYKGTGAVNDAASFACTAP